MCEYCGDGFPIKGFELCECQNIDVGVNGSTHKLMVNLSGDVDECLPIDINFCPMCGDPLTEPKPLSLTELRERIGKPVYHYVFGNEKASGWIILFDDDYGYGADEEYGITYVAFDRELRKDERRMRR